MAKQCSSSSGIGTGPRVFRNTFTRGGRRFRVRRWSVRIQHLGWRRTLALSAANKRQAQREADELYRLIRQHGWEAWSGTARPSANQVVVAGRRGDGSPALPRTSLDYWRQRLIQRRYLELARAAPDPELSVRLELEGVWYYFPLATTGEMQAARQARRIWRAVLAHGWSAACERFARELTIAIFWSGSPVACTYMTFLTFVRGGPLPPAPLPARREPGKRILLLEGDQGVREALAFWLDRQPGFACPSACGDPAEAVRRWDEIGPDLVFLNRAALDPATTQFVEEIRKRQPGLPVFTYGIYAESDQIFMSVSGVEAGYVFRRRVPTELLDPIRGAARVDRFTTKVAFAQIREYFQSFFLGATLAIESEPQRFTMREVEILSYVSKGYPDKEIADTLKISVWTVHNHLKRIYEKLQVHSRTEAAVRYLQK